MVVDVLRAFTTTAYAFDRGAKEIILVSTIEEAFELRERDGDYLLVGEVNGLPIDGFDLLGRRELFSHNRQINFS